jgi:ABC-type sugar transport system ATPase subunit
MAIPARSGIGARSYTSRPSSGRGIFLISHDIHDVFDLADRISVMLQGMLVGTVDKIKVTKDEVLAMIIIGKLPQDVSAGEIAELVHSLADGRTEAVGYHSRAARRNRRITSGRLAQLVRALAWHASCP